MTVEQHNRERIMELADEFKRRGTRVVAITIARGGSRRIPRKNTLPFAGKPLVEWSIIQSVCSHLITDTYLSTDDEEIAEIGRRAGARIIWRYEPGEAGVTAALPFSQAIRQIREYHPIDTLLSILPTNPIRHPWDFDENIWLYWELRKKYPACRAVGPLAPVLETVIHRRIDDHRSVVMLGDKKRRCLDGAGSAWTVADADWYLNMQRNGPTYDAEIDDIFVEISQKFTEAPQGNVSFYYPIEHYQRFDLDEPDQIGVLEGIMTRYILTTSDVYERYKEEG